MSPAVLAALIALLEEAIKMAPELVKDVEALIHPSTTPPPAPLEPEVAKEMAPLDAKLTP